MSNTFAAAAPRIRTKETIVKILEKIRRTNDHINAFVSITADCTVPETERGAGKLKGVTVAVKDNIHVKGHASSCASAMLREALRTSGAVIVGKTNMDEFGMGSASTRSIFGPVLNPQFLPLKHSAGGSSGGSAAAVAAGLCDIALGTDTGGSVRLPASYCGVYGFKPSYGRISRNGLVAYASSLDTVGLLGADARGITDAFNVLKTTGGLGDMTSHQRSEPLCPLTTMRPLRVGIPKEVMMHLKGPAVNALSVLIDRLVVRLNASIEYISIPSLDYSLATYYTLAMVEAASCLARYPLAMLQQGRDELRFGEHVEQRVRLGRWMASHQRGAVFFGKAMERRNGIKAELAELLTSRLDLLICPTAIDGAPTLEDSCQEDPDLWSESNWERVLESDFHFSNTHLGGLMADLLTVPASLAQIPAISCPVQDHCGVQLMAAKFRDEELLDLTTQLFP